MIVKNNILPILFGRKKIRMEEIVTDKIAVVESHQTILKVLSILKKSKNSICFVNDKMGKFIGIVTMADIIELIAFDEPTTHSENQE